MLGLNIGEYFVDESKEQSRLEAIAPISSLFLLFLVIGGNFLAPLFPCRFRSLLDNNMYAKHIVAFLTLLFFIKLTNNSKNLSLNQEVGQSVWLYIWFVFASSMETRFFIWLVVLFAIMYTLDIYIREQEAKSNLVKDSNSTLKRLDTLEDLLYYLAIGLTMAGVILNLGKKRILYGKQFSIVKFLFGMPDCDKISKPVSDMAALRNLFGRK